MTDRTTKLGVESRNTRLKIKRKSVRKNEGKKGEKQRNFFFHDYLHLSIEFAGNSKYVRHEIELLNQLRHRNILRHLGACVDGGTLHPLTEFIEGGDLETLLQVKHFKSRNFISLTLDLP